MPAKVIGIHDAAQAQLLEIVQTTDPKRLRLGSRQRRQQQRGQNGDDRDDHQQFNQR